MVCHNRNLGKEENYEEENVYQSKENLNFLQIVHYRYKRFISNNHFFFKNLNLSK